MFHSSMYCTVIKLVANAFCYDNTVEPLNKRHGIGFTLYGETSDEHCETNFIPVYWNYI